MGVIAGATAATKIMLAMSAASTAIAAAGAKKQSDFQKAQFRSAEAQNRRLEQDALALGREHERSIKEEGDALRARQRTGFSALGFDITAEGSPQDIISATAGINLLESLNARRDALLQAQGFDFAARDMALRRDFRSRNAGFEIGNTFITGALQGANIWRSGRRD